MTSKQFSGEPQYYGEMGTNTQTKNPVDGSNKIQDRNGQNRNIKQPKKWTQKTQ